ncbi:predicted protein [Naegleria gruberi]|uniref:Predicted protein n=1 Tax=Naegleria gruberi TaxID=5762 RepID=D2VNE1_NAEGR|nr:uncharacterized protein NAEGRDRAFT_70463 [Naegleria gruberi]EFC41721.1 predicted protein [Naegleria gruberi]|eukprot:XP_002674465.1 predicted protein [Naegleria gruberi strain NEG-M]
MNSNQEIINFIQSNSGDTKDVLILKVGQRFGISIAEAKDALDLVVESRRVNSTTSAPSSQTFVYQKQGGNGFSGYRNEGSQVNRPSSSVGGNRNGGKNEKAADRYQLEKQLIKMKLERESKKLRKEGITNFLESKKTNLVSFDKCVNEHIDPETFKSLTILAKKDRTYVLYYLYVGLDLERITVLMNEHGSDSKKVKKIVDKLSKENHPIWVKYSQKHAIYKAYSEKVEEICTKKDPSFLEKLLSVFRSDKTDDNSSQKSSKNDKSNKASSNTTSSAAKDKNIDLSKLNNENDLIGKSGIFRYDQKNDLYVLKTTGDYKGKDKVCLRDTNKAKFEQLLNGKPLPAKIIGKIDWVQLGNNLVVGARCSAKQ